VDSLDAFELGVDRFAELELCGFDHAHRASGDQYLATVGGRGDPCRLFCAQTEVVTFIPDHVACMDTQADTQHDTPASITGDALTPHVRELARQEL